MKNIKKYKLFPKLGYCDFGRIISREKCLKLKNKIKKLRKLDKKLFYRTEKEFLKKGRYYRYAPGSTEHNLLISKELNHDLSFIEKSPTFVKSIESLMGKNYKIMKKTIIRSVPHSYLPGWLEKKLIDVGRPNLNPWIKDKFQDIQYFLNADFHQDMTRGNKHCTYYIYLDDVEKKNSSLKLLAGSHVLGVQPYPHYLRKSNNLKDVWYYNGLNSQITVKQMEMIGKSGTVFCFNGLVLHGTYYNFGKNPRISLRYLIQPNPQHKNTPFAKSFKFVKGKIGSKKDERKLRLDKNWKDGSFIPTGMSITY